MSLTVILGCMFAQKTTELVRQVRRWRSIGRRVLVVHHALDQRYQEQEPAVVTHDHVKEAAVTAERLADITWKDYDLIAIDEGQFFPDLMIVTQWADQGIHVIVAGLDGTSDREPFGDMLRLLPHAEEVIRLSALCVHCRDGTRAIYSRRVTPTSDVVCVGGAEAYEPVCRRHYLAHQ
jgi:thymidine kinase